MAALVLAGCEPSTSSTRPSESGSPAARVATADFGDVSAPDEVRRVAAWVVASNDHAALPFAIVDKIAARGYVFSAKAGFSATRPCWWAWRAATRWCPASASARWRRFAPRNAATPAGRFASVPGHTTGGDRVFWLDYDEGIAMHTVVTNVPAEERLRRMASPDPAEHRISYGCINFPPSFFDQVLAPALARRGSVVYVLPDTRQLAEVFPSLAEPGEPGGAAMAAARVARAADR